MLRVQIRLVDEARCEIADAVVAIQKLVATGAEQVAWHSTAHLKK